MLTHLNSLNLKNKFLFIDGFLLIILGAAQSINSLVGYFVNIGFYKILNELKFATLGVFETSCLLLIIGIILIKVSNENSVQRFWNFIASIIHFVIIIANIILWKDSFVINHAEFSGVIATVFHIFFFSIEFALSIKKKVA